MNKIYTKSDKVSTTTSINVNDGSWTGKSKILFRPLRQEDENTLWNMLYEAANMKEGNETIQEAKEKPELARYIKDWMREDVTESKGEEDSITPLPSKRDFGYLAYYHEIDDNNDFGDKEEAKEIPVGAIWMRSFSSENKGYGYWNDKTPELAMGIIPSFRGQGIGTQLINTLIEETRNNKKNGEVNVISLSVRETNPAVRLYERVGFKRISGTEKINRAGGISFTMLLSLQEEEENEL